MIPPPRQISPSYSTADWPGVAAHCGVSKARVKHSPSTAATVHAASACRYRVFAPSRWPTRGGCPRPAAPSRKSPPATTATDDRAPARSTACSPPCPCARRTTARRSTRACRRRRCPCAARACRTTGRRARRPTCVLRRADRPRRHRQIAVQELAERPLADEADAGRVLLLRVGQADLGGDAPHLGLAQFAHRKHRARELRLVQAVQEVALVLRRIEPAQQAMHCRRPRAPAHSGPWRSARRRAPCA